MSEMHICETCRDEINPAAPGVVRAVELIRTDAPEGVEYLEGMGVFFHQGCFPAGSSRYRRKDP